MDLNRFTSGVNNVVLELVFSDGVRWILRVRLPYAQEDDGQIETDMLSELATLKIIKDRTNIPVSEIFAYNVDKSNPFGYRYMLTEALPGCTLGTGFARSVPFEHQEKVASQFANYYHQLTSLRFDKIGRLWCGKAIDHDPIVTAFADGEGRVYLAYLFYGLNQILIRSQEISDHFPPLWSISTPCDRHNPEQ